jgi:pilus assembly protein FimV
MQRVVLHFAVAITVWASAATAGAMGFGNTSTQTSLGQPLNFVAAVMLDGDETVAPNCIAAEVYAGDSRIPPPRVSAALKPSSVAGQARIRVTTSTRID